jgi:hypothetical protein
MWPIRRFTVAVLALTVCAVPVASAQTSAGGDDLRARVVPATNVAGNSAGELLGDWYVNGLSLPVGESPFEGGASRCLNLGRGGRVLVPQGGNTPTACTLKLGRPVVLALTSADCSSAEPPPFRAFTAVGQALCAIKNVHDLGIQSLTVAVDDGRPVDIHNWRFAALSPQRRVVFPGPPPPETRPVFGAQPGPATFVAFGFLAEIRGMTVGQHEVKTLLDSQRLGRVAFDVTFNVVG